MAVRHLSVRPLELITATPLSERVSVSVTVRMFTACRWLNPCRILRAAWGLAELPRAKACAPDDTESARLCGQARWDGAP